MEKIKVKISREGAVEYSVEGVKGKSCRDLTRAIDQLAGEVIEDKTTAEFCELPEVESEEVRTRDK